jgi:DNA-binding NtrC family response regulator
MSLSEKEKNHKILVVDDEADVLEFLRMFLDSLGWEVTTASSVAEARAELDRGRFFLVLTDIAMPDMDGYEFMCYMQEKRVDAQVVLMTGFGYNPHHTLVKINKALRYPCLFKPFDRTKVAESILLAWTEYHKGTTVPALDGATVPQEETPTPAEPPAQRIPYAK